MMRNHTISPMKHILNYLAGYTDGDGCFAILKLRKSKFGATFIISSTDKNVLEYFKSHFEGKVRLVRQVGNEKAQYHFIKYGQKSYSFVKQFSHLLVEKKQEAELFCWFFECGNKKEKALIFEDMKKLRLTGLAKPTDKQELESIANTISPTEEDFAYLAGFIDAECNLGLQRYKNAKRPNYLYKAILQCNNTRSQSIKWIVSRYGGNVHFIERKKYGKNHKDQLAWRISSKSLAKILPKIHPYLRYKKAVCEQLMNFSKTTIYIKDVPGRRTQKYREFYAKVLEERELIFDTIHKLNRKGL